MPKTKIMRIRRTWKETEQAPTNWLGQAKRHATKIRPEAVGSGIFGCFFSIFAYCRTKAAGDVTSGVAVDQVSADVRVKCGDSRLNSGQIIRLYADRTSFMHFLAGDRKRLVVSYPAYL